MAQGGTYSMQTTTSQQRAYIILVSDQKTIRKVCDLFGNSDKICIISILSNNNSHTKRNEKSRVTQRIPLTWYNGVPYTNEPYGNSRPVSYSINNIVVSYGTPTQKKPLMKRVARVVKPSTAYTVAFIDPRPGRKMLSKHGLLTELMKITNKLKLT